MSKLESQENFTKQVPENITFDPKQESFIFSHKHLFLNPHLSIGRRIQHGTFLHVCR